MTVRSLLVAVPSTTANYPGELPDLPGTEVDVKVMTDLLADRGAPAPATLVGLQATLEAVQRALLTLASATGPEDLTIFYFAGHGVGLTDASHDEDDGTDEALVCADGFLFDDWFADRFWGEAQGGSSWVMIVDACASRSAVLRLNEETTFLYPKPPDLGLLLRWQPPSHTKDTPPVLRAAAPENASPARHRVAAPLAETATPPARLVYAACSDTESATELPATAHEGARGLFTTMLDAELREHPERTYLDLPAPLTARVVNYPLSYGYAAKPRFFYDDGNGQLTGRRALSGEG